MKIMIDILHPFDVHLFKNMIKIMEHNDHEILVTSRQKEMTNYLLDKFEIDYICISKIGESAIDLGKELFIRTFKFLKIAKNFNPDLLIGVMGPTITPVGKLLHKPTIVFYGTEHAKYTNSWVYPLATEIITQSSYKDNLGKKHTKFNGIFEFAYLHPKYFQPDLRIFKKLGIKNSEKYAIVRFVSWQASHDMGKNKMKMSLEEKKEIINLLSSHLKVFVSSEKKLPPELEKYQLNIPYEFIHDILSFAEIYVGEGATMASEAALLGVPSVYINPLSLGFLEELESKYELIYNFKESKEAITKITDLLESNDNLKSIWKNKREKILKDSVDVTKFIIDACKKYDLHKENY
jgi:uncharacterized protein